MVLIVIVKEDIVHLDYHVFVKVLSWEIIVKDVPLNLIHSLEMVSVNVILDMFN